jgi:hypothetical protein
VDTISPKIRIFEKNAKENNCPIGENSPNLVTLSGNKKSQSMSNRHHLFMHGVPLLA